MKVVVLGAGAWGTAMAKVIAEKGNPVLIWAFEKSVCEDINTGHKNSQFLPDIKLPLNISATNDILEAVEDTDFLIIAIPSLYLLNTVKLILNAASIREGKTAIAVITKGFLPSSNGPRLILEVLEDYLPGFYQHSLVYIAGPSHAEEVSRGKITGLIAASENAKNSIRFRDLIKTPRLLVFSSFDVRGVQVAAAVKNVIAIIFGILDALKNSAYADKDFAALLGDGTESLLLAAGLNEIQLLGRALKATHSETFTSISGVGDLDVTCRSVFGRNRRFGWDIIEKRILNSFSDIDDLINRIGEIGYMPEGIAAAKYVKILIEEHHIKAYVSIALYRILNKEKEPEEILKEFLDSL